MGKLFIGTIIIAALVFVGGMAYIIQKNSQTKEAGVSVEIAEKPSISKPHQTTDPTASWKIYRNEKYGFEVKYPLTGLLSRKEQEKRDKNGSYFYIIFLYQQGYEVSITVLPYILDYIENIDVSNPADEAYGLMWYRYINGIKWFELCCDPGIYANTRLMVNHNSLGYVIYLSATTAETNDFRNLVDENSSGRQLFKAFYNTFRFLK